MFDLSHCITSRFPLIYQILKGKQNWYKETSSSQTEHVIRHLRKLGAQCVRSDGGYFVYCNGNAYYLHGSTAGINGGNARKICKNKYRLKQLLVERGFRCPQGLLFSHDRMPKQSEVSLDYPCVMKPVDGSQGRGVKTDISSYDDLMKYWSTVGENEKIVIEKFVAGLDLRCCVIGGKLVAAASRINAHVIGNGSSTIEELIREKTAEREHNPITGRNEITIDIPIDLHYVPRDEELVILSSTANVSTGAEIVDVTDELSPEVRTCIESAVQSFDGANCIGVDTITMSFTDPSQLYFIEFNASAGFLIHRYPSFGTPRHFGAHIAQYIINSRQAVPLDQSEIEEIRRENADNSDVNLLLWEYERLRRESGPAENKLGGS